MTRRFRIRPLGAGTRWKSARPAAVAVAAVLAVSACGLGGKQAETDRVLAASARLDAAASVPARIAVRVTKVKSDKPAVPGPPRIVEAALPPVPAVLDLKRGDAAVGVRDGDPAAAALVFLGSAIYERLPPKDVSTAPKPPATAATNLLAIAAIGSGQVVAVDAAAPAAQDATPAVGDTSPSTTTTTATTSATPRPSPLQRAPRIPRQWIAFDYRRLDEKDTTKRAGSLAINPVTIVGLTQGLLTGSVTAHPVQQDGQALTRYDGNVSRDKAERRLSEDDRKLLDKVFAANAVSGRTYPAHIWLDAGGNLRRFEVRLGQRLTNVDRANLTVTIDIAGPAGPVTIPRPDPKATGTVESLGQLVTAVSGT